MFEIEVEIDGRSVTTKRWLTLAMLCIMPIPERWRRVVVNEARNGIMWCISKLIPWKSEPVQVKEMTVKIVAERGLQQPDGSRADIFKKKLITFQPALSVANVPSNEGRIGMGELIGLACTLAEELCGGLVDFLLANGTVIEYYKYAEDGAKSVNVHLVTDVDGVPKEVTENLLD